MVWHLRWKNTFFSHWIFHSISYAIAQNFWIYWARQNFHLAVLTHILFIHILNLDCLCYVGDLLTWFSFDTKIRKNHGWTKSRPKDGWSTNIQLEVIEGFREFFRLGLYFHTKEQFLFSTKMIFDS